MSNSINKNFAKMHRAKDALRTLSNYSRSCNTPNEFAELGNLLLASIYQLADKKDSKPLKSIYALSSLNDVLNKRVVKARYSNVSELTARQQEKIMLNLHVKKYSYQKIADELNTKYGIKISKSKVYQTIKRLQNGL